MRVGIVHGADTSEAEQISPFDGVAKFLHGDGHEAFSVASPSAGALLRFELDGLLLRSPASYDALELCRELRARRSRALILIVAGRFDAAYARDAFGAGCDDYLMVPIAPQTLLDRLSITAVRNDTLPPSAHDLMLGALRIDALDRVWVGKSLQSVPRKEVALLRCLAATRGELVRSEQLTAAGWGHMRLGSNTLEVHMSRLRRWLRLTLGPGAIEIRAVRGAGYLLASR